MTATPYADEAFNVLNSGLGSPVPVPYGQKKEPIKGWTGSGAPYAGADHVGDWVVRCGTSNIAVRVADGVVGLDVDAYKPVAVETLAEFEDEWGDLAPTVVSTSREYGASGIRWYRVESGKRWPSSLGPGVEVIHPGHRYAVWKGSRHPEGGTYRLDDWRTGEADVKTPKVDDLPHLTEGQQQGLLAKVKETQAESVAYSGPTWDDLGDVERGVLADSVPALVQERLQLLREMADWPDGQQDEFERGWEKRTADVAQTFRTLLAEGWSGMDPDSLYQQYLKAAPGERGSSADPVEKWRTQAGKPAADGGRIRNPLAMFMPFPDWMTAESGDVEPDFWSQRESLQRVHDWARARMASPWAVLGVALARVLVTVPPRVVLPPTIGTYASLNLFVALVAPSGLGKGAAMGTATDALQLSQEVHARQAGSGEGLVKQFAHREKGEVVRDRDAVFFDIPEVDTLASLSSRQGANLLPVMRSAWSGERLGFAYADPTKDIPLEPHSYRLCAVVGVQPARAGGLFAEADGGTPQRFIWLPAADPDIPDTEPPEPEPWAAASAMDQRWDSFNGRVELPLPAVAVDTIKAAHRARARGEADALDGHSLLSRAKVMAGLAFLDGRRTPTEEDWAVAGQVMEVSDGCRTSVLGVLSERAEQSAVSSGRLAGVKAAVADDAQHAAQLKRVKNNLLGKFTDTWQPLSDLRRSVAARDRSLFDEAVELLVAALDVEIAEGKKGRRGRLRP